MSKVPDGIHLDWSLLGEPLIAKLDELTNDIEHYAKSPGGRWLTVDQVLDIRHQLKQIQKRVADSRPFAQCKNWPNCKRGCRVCDGAGFIPKRLKEVVK